MQMYLERIKKYVVRLFELRTTPDLCYHNLEHTQTVVKNATEMADFYHLNDTGQLFGPMDGHEKRGAYIMEQFLHSQKVDPSTIAEISKAIMATVLNAEPEGLIEEILRDADVYHLGTHDFRQIDKLVWKETEQRTKKKIADKLQKSLVFLNKHQFYTTYCKDRLLAGKNANVAYLKSLIKAS